MKTYAEKDMRIQMSTNQFVQRSFKIEKTYFTKAANYIDEERKLVKSRSKQEDRWYKEDTRRAKIHLRHIQVTEKHQKDLLKILQNDAKLMKNLVKETKEVRDNTHALKNREPLKTSRDLLGPLGSLFSLPLLFGRRGGRELLRALKRAKGGGFGAGVNAYLGGETPRGIQASRSFREKIGRAGGYKEQYHEERRQRREFAQQIAKENQEKIKWHKDRIREIKEAEKHERRLGITPDDFISQQRAQNRKKFVDEIERLKQESSSARDYASMTDMLTPRQKFREEHRANREKLKSEIEATRTGPAGLRWFTDMFQSPYMKGERAQKLQELEAYKELQRKGYSVEEIAAGIAEHGGIGEFAERALSKRSFPVRAAQRVWGGIKGGVKSFVKSPLHPIKTVKGIGRGLGVAARGIGKVGGLLGKLAPFLGLGIGGALAAQDFSEGNYFGGTVNALSGIASVIPGLGPVVSIALEAIAALIPKGVQDAFNKVAGPVFQEMWGWLSKPGGVLETTGKTLSSMGKVLVDGWGVLRQTIFSDGVIKWFTDLGRVLLGYEIVLPFKTLMGFANFIASLAKGESIGEAFTNAFTPVWEEASKVMVPTIMSLITRLFTGILGRGVAKQLGFNVQLTPEERLQELQVKRAGILAGLGKQQESLGLQEGNLRSQTSMLEQYKERLAAAKENPNTDPRTIKALEQNIAAKEKLIAAGTQQYTTSKAAYETQAASATKEVDEQIAKEARQVKEKEVARLEEEKKRQEELKKKQEEAAKAEEERRNQDKKTSESQQKESEAKQSLAERAARFLQSIKSVFKIGGPNWNFGDVFLAQSGILGLGGSLASLGDSLFGGGGSGGGGGVLDTAGNMLSAATGMLGIGLNTLGGASTGLFGGATGSLGNLFSGGGAGFQTQTATQEEIKAKIIAEGKRQGLNDESLKAVLGIAAQETGFSNVDNAKHNPEDGVGVFQFTPKTGRDYGLKDLPRLANGLPDPRDERLNIDKNIAAGVALFKDNLAATGSIKGAIIAHNAGAEKAKAGIDPGNYFAKVSQKIAGGLTTSGSSAVSSAAAAGGLFDAGLPKIRDFLGGTYNELQKSRVADNPFGKFMLDLTGALLGDVSSNVGLLTGGFWGSDIQAEALMRSDSSQQRMNHVLNQMNDALRAIAGREDPVKNALHGPERDRMVEMFFGPFMTY
jgi:hypothetical protein